MTMHQIEFEYKLPEWGAMEIDLDPSFDKDEKEAVAMAEIKESFGEVEDIEITDIKEL